MKVKREVEVEFELTNEEFTTALETANPTDLCYLIRSMVRLLKANPNPEEIWEFSSQGWDSWVGEIQEFAQSLKKVGT